MTEQPAGLECVVGPMQTPLREYAQLVREIVGGNAKSLALFGAIATGSFDRSRHTARNVLIVDRVDLSVLRRLAEHGAKLGKAAIAAPLVMTPAYIKTSLDTFPLEFIEIHQKHVMLFGDEYFDDLSFDDGHIRLQCEREFKTILISLRQGLLAAAGREKFIGALEVDVTEGLMRTLRGMLWLKGRKEAKPADDVLTEIETIAERKLTGVHIALDPSAHHGWNEFESLYGDVEALGEITDAW